MALKQLAGIVFILASAFSAYVPHLLTRGEARMSGKELADQYAERAWVRYVYPFLYLLIFFGAAFLFFVSFTKSGMFLVADDNWFFVIGGVLGCIPFFNGIFSLLTGVIPVNQRRQYLYVFSEELYLQVGLILMAIGIFFVLTAALAFMFWN